MVAGGGAGTNAPSSASGSAAVSSPALFTNGGRLTHLFTRTTGDITIRAFLAEVPGLVPAAGMQTYCGTPFLQPRLEVEVSTPKMVGTAFGYSSAVTSAVKSTIGSTLGVAEGDPVTVVIADTSSSVANARFVGNGGAVDQMNPVQGWSALAVHVPTAPKASVGSLFAQTSSGSTLQKTTVNQGYSPLPAALGNVPGCYCHSIAGGSTRIFNGGVVAGGAPGSTGSASSGSGNASSGSASSGRASGGTSIPAPAPQVACPMIPAGGAASSSK